MIRKSFLLSAATAAAIGTPLAGCSALEHGSAFDRTRFKAVLSKPAKHRQCFGNTTFANGKLLALMANSMTAYERTLGEGPGALHAVAVLYNGFSVALALDDQVWKDVVWPSNLLAHESGVPDRTSGNPFERGWWSRGPSVSRLAQRGAYFFVCDNALRDMSGAIAARLKETESGVYHRVASGLIPNAMIVPAGVMAINACQEAHFTYIQATL